MPLPKKKIHILGIGGVGMGALAGLLCEAGMEVTGAEGQKIYPPMRTLLEELHIPLWIGYSPENLLQTRPELVVVGNVIRYDNPEVQAVLEHKIPYLSFPETLNGYFLRDKKSLVVAGTHGKTTTSSLLAYTLGQLGQDPLFLVGGLLKDRGRNFRYGKGPFAVLEGDEYDTAFFDKRPKFIHYAPFGGLLTSIEFDHADIYPDFSSLKQAFSDFVSLIPPDGLLVVADHPEAVAVASKAKGKVLVYGKKGPHVRLLERQPLASPKPGQRLILEFQGKTYPLFLPLIGPHNAENALGVFSLLLGLGYEGKAISQAMGSFPGVKRRQEQLLNEPVIILDDFAHHPTAVRVTIEAVKETWPGRRVVAVFEARTNTSRRKFFQEEYAKALAGADMVLLKTLPFPEKTPLEERLDLEKLVQDLRVQRVPAQIFEGLQDGLNKLLGQLRPQDIVLFMSNGPLEGLPQVLASAVKKGFRSPEFRVK